MVFVVAVAVLVVATFAASAIWRFSMVRGSGSRAMIRQMPAEGIHGWRHGVLRYDGERMLFYKLRSLSFTHDMVADRRLLQFTGLRDVTADERQFMPDISKILQVDSPDGGIEFAADRRTQMGFISWIESAPDVRAERTDMRSLEERAQRETER
ncbi:DUF2550 domain-containing protein [uncultured Corynebacterium sp.]|uniref:DUF2550 domain-containing protein n=1 Tax=uncultured Corynebacterium sp. TaxID=159447 RepID=UPI0012B9FA94|nr:DUF2550 domain-containing protein [uncultured Corynebacterium sp.]